MKSNIGVKALCALLLFSACTEEIPLEGVQTGKLLLHISLPGQPGKTAGQQSLDSLRCVINKQQDNLFDQYLSTAQDLSRTQIELPAGTGYSLWLYGAVQGEYALRASKGGIKITAGKTTTVQLELAVFQVVLSQPADGETSKAQTPAFQWNVVAGAQSYALQVSATADFATLAVAQQNLTQNHFTPSTVLPEGLFYWHARAKDNSGNWGAWSNAWRFSISTNTPGLLAPANGSLVSDNLPEFSWKAYTGAAAYQLQVSSNSGFGVLALDQPELANTVFRGGAVLNEGATYYWRVRAKDAQGKWSSWSAIWNFRIQLAGPTAPALLTPAPGTLTSDDAPIFNWTAVAGAVKYHWQLAYGNDFIVPVLSRPDLLANSFAPAQPLSDSTYYWRVRAQDQKGDWGDWSPSASLKILTRPSPLAPAHGSATNDNTPSFSWQSVPQATAYHLQVSSLPQFSSVLVDESSLSNLSFTSPAVLPEGSYYWRVRALNQEGRWLNWSTTFRFTVIISGPFAPVLREPESHVTTSLTKPVYVWEKVASASGYNLQVSGNSSFENPKVDVWTAATHYVDGHWVEYDRGSGFEYFPLSPGLYYWRVRAKDLAGNIGTWSAVWSFTVVSNGPMPPALAAPANERAIVGSVPTLIWNSDVNAAKYDVQLSLTDTFENLEVFERDYAGTQLPVNRLLSEQKHYWRVRAYDGQNVQSGWSTVWSFIVDRSLGEMVLIPAGWFSMGSAGGEADEKPVHSVYLDAFYMDKYEVTNAQYKIFCDVTGRSYPPDPTPGYFLNYPDYPVVNVNWDQAYFFAQWAGKRLPTEAEWEKAARGGLDNQDYPWGNEAPAARCNYLGYQGGLQAQMADFANGRGPLAPGKFAPNDYGLFDMSGNVWEWCFDYYGAGFYATSPERNPVGGGSSQRVVRGGSWQTSLESTMRGAERSSLQPTSRTPRNGFRCARTP